MIIRHYSEYVKKNVAPQDPFPLFEDLLGKEWLKKEEESPAHQLWRDPSPIASTELFIYESCLREVGFSKSWIRDRRKNIHGDSSRRNIAGILNEIMTASIFKAAGYNVVIPSNSQPV